ncbi:hypothetical protein B0H13DRAFT_2339434 [Mycena leptocephala]|nr:hypothetical protein B0H13DRAFT_2339434 [Mycena leptocephala]
MPTAPSYSASTISQSRPEIPPIPQTNSRRSRLPTPPSFPAFALPSRVVYAQRSLDPLFLFSQVSLKFFLQIARRCRSTLSFTTHARPANLPRRSSPCATYIAHETAHVPHTRIRAVCTTCCSKPARGRDDSNKATSLSLHPDTIPTPAPWHRPRPQLDSEPVPRALKTTYELHAVHPRDDDAPQLVRPHPPRPPHASAPVHPCPLPVLPRRCPRPHTVPSEPRLLSVMRPASQRRFLASRIEAGLSTFGGPMLSKGIVAVLAISVLLNAYLIRGVRFEGALEDEDVSTPTPVDKKEEVPKKTDEPAQEQHGAGHRGHHCIVDGHGADADGKNAGYRLEKVLAPAQEPAELEHALEPSDVPIERYDYAKGFSHPSVRQLTPPPSPKSQSQSMSQTGFGGDEAGGERVNVLVAKRGGKKRAGLTNVPMPMASQQLPMQQSRAQLDQQQERAPSVFDVDADTWGSTTDVRIDAVEEGGRKRKPAASVDAEEPKRARTLGGERKRVVVPMKEIASGTGSAVRAPWSVGSINLSVPALMTRVVTQVEGSDDVFEAVNPEGDEDVPEVRVRVLALLRGWSARRICDYIFTYGSTVNAKYEFRSAVFIHRRAWQYAVNSNIDWAAIFMGRQKQSALFPPVSLSSIYTITGVVYSYDTALLSFARQRSATNPTANRGVLSITECSIAGGPTEYKQALAQYTKKLAEEGYKAKAEELIRDLLGPMYSVSLAAIPKSLDVGPPIGVCIITFQAKFSVAQSMKLFYAPYYGDDFACNLISRDSILVPKVPSLLSGVSTISAAV